MNSTIRLATRQLGLVLAALLPIAMAAPSMAADASVVAPAAAEQLQELDEVLVRGQRLSVEIADAEDEFYLLYNKLNKKAAYTMSCGERSINPGSRITTRVCVPGFYADNYARSTMDPVPLSLAFPGAQCTDYGNGFDSGNCNHSGYVPPPAAALLMERGRAWQEHMMKVIRSDARLSEMAGHLDVLHAEMQSVTRRYAGLRHERSKLIKSNRGPRYL